MTLFQPLRLRCRPRLVVAQQPPSECTCRTGCIQLPNPQAISGRAGRQGEMEGGRRRTEEKEEKQRDRGLSRGKEQQRRGAGRVNLGEIRGQWEITQVKNSAEGDKTGSQTEEKQRET